MLYGTLTGTIMFLRVNKPIPTAFSIFVGYNVPELSKHRKRRKLNSSAERLRDFAKTISSMLFENYWEKTYWRDSKQHFLDLAAFVYLFRILTRKE